MGFNFRDNNIIFALLVLLTVQILVLLWHMDLLPGLNTANKIHNQQIAGKILNFENKLKRRGHNSLIWEGSKEGQALFYNDSILTLSQSQAKIELENQTQLTIGENTLITIEPPSTSQQTDIKIKFNKGSFNARNPHNKTLIENEDMGIIIEKGSDIEISKMENGSTEIEIRQGVLNLVKNGENISLQKDQVVSIHQSELTKRQISERLKWSAPIQGRHYTHNQTHSLELQWQGQAKTLQITDGEGKEESVDIVGLQAIRHTFSRGNYRLRLVNDETVSQSRNIQIWQAPQLHLLDPRPRDRMHPGQIHFSWTPTIGASAYIFSAKGQSTQIEQEVTGTSVLIEFPNEDDIQWEVKAKDTDGVTIPANYHYPLYIRKNPFAPPKLHQPKVAPKEAKYSQPLWRFFCQLLLPNANASETSGLAALLSWDPVPGADFYVIEISNSDDFRTLIHTEHISMSQLIFSDKGSKPKLYWRVAAGSKQGQMGIFSEPALLEWKTLEEIDLATGKTQAQAKKNQAVIEKTQDENLSLPNTPAHSTPPGKNKQMPTTATPPKKSSPPSTSPPRKLIQVQSFRLWWAPQWSINQIHAGDTKSQLSGLQEMGLGSQLDLSLTQSHDLLILFNMQQMNFEPDPPPNYPFQSDVNSYQASVRLLGQRHGVGTAWLWGASLFMLPGIQRVDYESVDLIQQTGFGLQTGLRSRWNSFEYIGLLGAHTVGPDWGINILQQVIYQPNSYIIIGAEIEGTTYFDQQQDSLLLQLRALFGIQF
jgi:hypothetical protein